MQPDYLSFGTVCKNRRLRGDFSGMDAGQQYCDKNEHSRRHREVEYSGRQTLKGLN
jgi:hypothetical protein